MSMQINSLSQDELRRYKRQMVLPEIGTVGQERLKQAKILCIGAGGLGSPALLYLAAVGVGTLGIIDMDEVDVTNLQRQILFSENDAKTKKVRAASEKLRSLNKHVNIEIYEEALTAANAYSVMRNYDLVIDGTDNFTTKYLINDCAIKCNIPYIYGSVLGFEGRVMVVWGKKGPCYRCLYPNPPQGYIPNCAEFGVIGALPGMIGCIQAMEAIKCVINQDSDHALQTENKLKPLIGTLWIIDSRTMQSQSLAFKKKENCAACGQQPENIILKDLNPLCALSHLSSIPTITSSETKHYLHQPDVILLDVRDDSEWKSGHLPHATHLPLSQLMSDSSHLKNLNPDKTYLIYCHAGKRSQIAANYLKENGINKVMNLSGGISEWDGEIVIDN